MKQDFWTKTPPKGFNQHYFLLSPMNKLKARTRYYIGDPGRLAWWGLGWACGMFAAWLMMTFS